MGPLRDFRPWSTRRDLQLTGLSKTTRILNILDCVVISKLGGAAAASEVLANPRSELLLKAALEDVFVDVSQNPARRSFTGKGGVSKCLHTATSLYSFQRDGLVLPFELMLFQGHSLDSRVPQEMKQKELHDLAGQGICLPCLGLIIVSLMLSTGL